MGEIAVPDFGREQVILRDKGIESCLGSRIAHVQPARNRTTDQAIAPGGVV